MLPHYVYNIQVSQLPHSVTIMWYACFFQPALDWCFCLLFCRIGTLENEEEVAGMRMEDSKRSKRPHTFCRNNFQSLGWSPSTPLAPLIRKHLYDDTYNSFCTKNNSQIKKKNMDCMARKTWSDNLVGGNMIFFPSSDNSHSVLQLVLYTIGTFPRTTSCCSPSWTRSTP